MPDNNQTIYSDLVVYNDEFQGGYLERSTQKTALFNAGSNGSIVMRTEAIKGHYQQEAMWPLPSGLVARRDIASTDSVTPISITQDEFISVKLNRRIGPIDSTFDAFRKIMRQHGERQLSYMLGTQIADAVLAEKLNMAVRVLVAAMTEDASNVEYMSGGQVSATALTNGLKLMGDNSDRIVAWVMHSNTYFSLVKGQISANVDGLTAGVMRGATPASLGRPVYVTDSPQLENDDSPTGKYVLGLTQGAVEIIESETPDVVFDTLTGLANFVARLQGEYAYNVGVKGWKWATGSGGVNPTDSVLGTSTNWDKVVASHLDGPGIRIAVDLDG